VEVEVEWRWRWRWRWSGGGVEVEEEILNLDTLLLTIEIIDYLSNCKV
jgi:hypothetical protein